ncbi:hypothetical protein DE146DRAFT_161202 [Phaeosphaeria sp. MPI-PUGE-AT-0046c]|nr:hypothetical protein DE146DRAFT_161202 [Phaeosphaeria sp. MPI-PUGE-AT-0046c]
MRILCCLLYWSYIQLCSSFPVEEKPGFTTWPLEKRDLTPISELQFSGVKGVQRGTSEKSHFGVPDPTCRGKLPGDAGDKCWTMDQFSVDKMIDAREAKAKDCPVPCLFYTSKLSGAAERSANFVLWDVLLRGAAEGLRDFQTIWDLHDRKYYPKGDNLDATPEVKCAYKDAEEQDEKNGYSGCQRLYFMSMSKAMATECSGEVFVMTMTDLKEKQNVPTNGIWWEVEFPTLIDPNRPADKKVTKITYIQVPDKTDKEFEELRKIPQDERVPPEELFRGEYWPTGPGRDQLEGRTPPPIKRGDLQQNGNDTTSDYQRDANVERSPSTPGFVKRADRAGGEVCTYGEDCYPYPYPIENMFDWYNEATW